MLREQRNSKKQGDVGLGAAIGWFAEHGYTVCVPLTDSQVYDLIVDNGKLQRVQVKTVWNKRGNWFVVELRTRGGNRSGTGVSKKLDKTGLDQLFVLTELGECYLIPMAELGGTSSVHLTAKYTQYRVREAS